MPYITNTEKKILEHPSVYPETVGQLTYVLTRSALQFKHVQGKLQFVTVALVMGAFFCAALEFYRRVAAPYEDTKREMNGDVYE